MGVRIDDVPRELLAAVAGVGVIAILYALVVRMGRWARRARMRRRFVRAAEGEVEAAALLESRGFLIEGSQVTGTYTLNVDESPFEVQVRADYIVSRGDARFVAEVKTGRLAPKIETAATRRQLLEYAHAFEVDGVLLVDADARTVRHVAFARSTPERSWGGAWIVAAIVVAVLAIARLST